jgi:nucleotide-binding universal stress UspA family protein
MPVRSVSMTTLVAPESTAGHPPGNALSLVDASRGEQPETGAAAPIVVAVDDSSAARAAVEDGVRIARELDAPAVFVYVRRGPSAALGEPYHQRRLDREMGTGDRVLRDALAAASRAGIAATGEQLHGDPARRVAEFARVRGAQLVVVGSRRRRFGRSVSRAVTRGADAPVLVAGSARSAS